MLRKHLTRQSPEDQWLTYSPTPYIFPIFQYYHTVKTNWSWSYGKTVSFTLINWYLRFASFNIINAFTFNLYASIESENKLGWIGALRVAVSPPAHVPFTKQMHGWTRSAFHPSEVMKNYRKSWRAVPPSKNLFIVIIFLLIMFTLQGKKTPNTYMLLKRNAFQLLRWKNQS